ncbi:MAG: galactose-1-epimerase, partial [Clostridia bacterium]|nr:galactose-1-epimerase [Clostridia bacterium]
MNMITKKPFGKTADGEAVDLYTLTDGKISVNIITYGGAIQSVLVPGKNGETVDVALGYD